MLDSILEQVNNLTKLFNKRLFLKFINKDFKEYKKDDNSDNRLLILDPPYDLEIRNV